jgi:hypothetical protein
MCKLEFGKDKGKLRFFFSFVAGGSGRQMAAEQKAAKPNSNP